jgi:hypothetical protein
VYPQVQEDNVLGSLSFALLLACNSMYIILRDAESRLKLKQDGALK